MSSRAVMPVSFLIGDMLPPRDVVDRPHPSIPDSWIPIVEHEQADAAVVNSSAPG